MRGSQAIVAITVWILPIIFAMTLRGAAQGLVAYWCGDRTAWASGRVTLNPLPHIDPLGTILLPALCVFYGAPMFVWAKPVPVNFGALQQPRRDTILVAFAGPGANILMAIIAIVLLHIVEWLPAVAQLWVVENLQNAVILNVFLVVFNLIPLPPLDGGRIAIAVLPGFLARPLARLEPQGMLIILVLLFVLPFLGHALHMNLNFLQEILSKAEVLLVAFLWSLFGVAV